MNFLKFACFFSVFVLYWASTRGKGGMEAEVAVQKYSFILKLTSWHIFFANIIIIVVGEIRVVNSGMPARPISCLFNEWDLC